SRFSPTRPSRFSTSRTSGLSPVRAPLSDVVPRRTLVVVVAVVVLVVLGAILSMAFAADRPEAAPASGVPTSRTAQLFQHVQTGQPTGHEHVS
ncbi:hypothetical protein NON19_32425, partial [Streptomyces rubrisoli]|nr:hypothetical protein [Streptantibioticus rubrisoli]